ncbi:MAG: efflux RND transporter periplasmic adaptor subunit [Bacteroidia bacterium]|nr:efflux RND transporter periplasmic adaptor subunit [Bacteroidia bacterium]
MKNIIKVTAGSLFISAMIACGGGSGIEIKKAKLEELKAKQSEIAAEIKALETEIATSGDSTNSGNEKRKMVAIAPLEASTFEKYIDVQGRVDGDENVVLSAKVPASVIKIHVRAGDPVKKGQTLATLDGEIVKTQIKDLETNYKLVAEVFNKQKSLWEKGVGSEIQFLQAKTNKESLEQKLATLKENLDMYVISSPITGTVDEVNLKEGQMAAPGMPAIRVVNFAKLKVKADLAETYAPEVKSGNAVVIQFPDLNKEYRTNLHYSGRSIDQLNRTFKIEADLPSSPEYIPNMIAVVKVISYRNTNALVVPMSLVQESDGAKIVYVADKASKKAVKRTVTLGKVYNGKAEITSGLKAGDLIITAGYNDLNDQESIEF